MRCVLSPSIDPPGANALHRSDGAFEIAVTRPTKTARVRMRNRNNAQKTFELLVEEALEGKGVATEIRLFELSRASSDRATLCGWSADRGTWVGE
jgi:hypothetical protein